MYLYAYICMSVYATQFVHLAVRKMRNTPGSYDLQSQTVKKQFIVK